MTKVYAEPSPEQVEAIEGNTRLVRQMIAKLTGKDMLPGRDGVAFLDGFINRQRAGGTPPGKLINVVASYIGVALIEEIGGCWISDAEHGLGVELVPDVVCFPFAKTAKHFDKGASDSVLSFFEIGAMLAAERRDRPAPE